MSTQILATSNRHFEAIRDKRFEEIIDGYVKSPETTVFVEGPRTVTVGWDAIAKGWRGFVDSPLVLESVVWREIFQEEMGADLGWLSGLSAMRVRIGERVVDMEMRGSLVFRRQDRWRIFHEHFSIPHPDPYGIGDWLPEDGD